MNPPDPTKKTIDPDLLQACQRIATGLVVRYGNSLFSRIHGEMSEFSRMLAIVLGRAGCDEANAIALQNWLQQGLRPLSDYPPSIEVLLHLSYLIRTYPMSEYQMKMKHVWYALDTAYSQTYFKNWRNEKPLDEMTRERVWLSAFDELCLTEAEVTQIRQQFNQSGLFRQFPPSLEQFKDAAMAIRKGAPLVEVAWLEATNRQAQDTHPLVVQARGAISSHDLNVHARERDTEYRFKAIYRKLLSDEYVSPVSVIEHVPRPTEYESRESITERLARWAK